MNERRLDDVIEFANGMPWTDREFYKEILAQTYYFTSHSVEMLKVAAQSTTHGEYARHLLAHVKEETGHDKIAIADLKFLGGKIEDYPECPITKTMWQTQLSRSLVEPSSLLGYIHALEKMAVVMYGKQAPIIARAHGEKAARFVKLHAEEDVAHVEHGRKQIMALGVVERGQAESAMNFTADMLELLIQRAHLRSGREADVRAV